MSKNILITGGAGFIGSHVVRLFVNKYPGYKIVNLDALTYAGNLENLKDIEQAPNYAFEHANILEPGVLQEIFEQHDITDVIHLAAESHVDRSILSPMDFIYTNIIGTVNLLTVAKNYWKENLDKHRFHHVSTDEVYGTLGDEGLFTEQTGYAPNSPYSSRQLLIFRFAGILCLHLLFHIRHAEMAVCFLQFVLLRYHKNINQALHNLI